MVAWARWDWGHLLNSKPDKRRYMDRNHSLKDSNDEDGVPDTWDSVPACWLAAH